MKKSKPSFLVRGQTYDGRYAHAKQSSGKLPWGDVPTYMVRKFVRNHATKLETPRVHVLDVGGGYGRNSLFLLGELVARGVDARVTNLDSSREGLRMFKQYARLGGVSEARRKVGPSLLARVRAVKADIRHVPAQRRRSRPSDVVLVSHVLQSLRPIEQDRLIRHLMRKTRPGGFHVISAFSNEIVYPEEGNRVERPGTWFSPRGYKRPPDFWKHVYERAGWRVDHEIRTGVMTYPLPHPDGKPYHVRVDSLIARKPK